jgi:transaldolase
MNPARQLHELGQSLWLDNISRTMLDDGSLEHYVEDLAVTGLTSNPTIFATAVMAGDVYDEQLAELRGRGLQGEELFFELALSDLRRAAEILAGVHRRTDGVDGWVSLEVSPLLADDSRSTIEQVADLHSRASDNIFIKIPGTAAGRKAIEESTFAGTPINVTLLFSTEQYVDAADAYMRGVERRIEAGLDPAVPSVASLFVSRWDQAVAGETPDELAGRLGIAVAMRTYRAYRQLLESERWLRLQDEGARPQRLLWASTGSKDPQVSDVLYVESLAAPLTINTMPEATLLAFAEHGRVRGRLPVDGGDSDDVLSAYRAAGFNLRGIAKQLQRDGARRFDDSWTDLIGSITTRGEELVGAGGPRDAA